MQGVYMGVDMPDRDPLESRSGFTHPWWKLTEKVDIMLTEEHVHRAQVKARECGMATREFLREALTRALCESDDEYVAIHTGYARKIVQSTGKKGGQE